MSLTNRFTQLREHAGSGYTLPVAAATIIYWGNLVATNAQGNAVPATDTAGLVVAGVAQDYILSGGGFLGNGGQGQQADVDNSTGVAGACKVTVRQNLFRFRNSSSSPLGVADLGTMAVVQDPETVAKASTNNIAAGVVLILEQGFVWIWLPCYPLSVPASAWRSFGVGTFGS